MSESPTGQDVQAEEVIQGEPPALPFIYLDWSIVQYLRREAAFGPLLISLLNSRLCGAALLPYSVGHILDSTARWTTLSDEHKAERLRDLTFMDGLGQGTMWEIDRTQAGPRHRLRFESIISACEVRGHFSSLRTDPEASEMLAQMDSLLVANLEEKIVEIRNVLSAAPGLPAGLADDTAETLREVFGNGVPELTDAGHNMMRLLRVWHSYMRAGLPRIDDVPPERAVAQLEENFRRYMPGVTVETMWAAAMQQGADLDPDDYYPGALGWMGYHAESAKSFRRGAPGYIADQSHGKFALASAIFLTGERSLSRRLEAWAAHTGRGRSHRRWPIILQVTPDDDLLLQRAKAVVDAYSSRWGGEADQLLRELDQNSG